ncbi:hypothetical protein ALQ79_200273 [Pseudomonas amygdali pv. lachrymans]|nr:hypothetical protein ALQ79_200273 [Pseudomonas amygdali pv. lachrymans]
MVYTAHVRQQEARLQGKQPASFDSAGVPCEHGATQKEKYVSVRGISDIQRQKHSAGDATVPAFSKNRVRSNGIVMPS